MRSQHFQQVRLSPKQVVFLLIAAAAVGAVIFLFGVLVGRGVPLAQVLTGGMGAGMANSDRAFSDERPVVVGTPRRLPSAVATDGVRLSYYERLAGDRGPELDAGFGVAGASPAAARAGESGAGTENGGMPEAPPREYPGGYAVQVTALQERTAAEQMAERLNGKAIRRSSWARWAGSPCACSGCASGPTQAGKRPSGCAGGLRRKKPSRPG